MTQDENTSKTDDENPYPSAKELLDVDDEDTDDPLKKHTDDLPEDANVLQCGTVIGENGEILDHIEINEPTQED